MFNKYSIINIILYNLKYHRSSVRVIRSSRGGVGKSLFKSRMVDSLTECLPNIERTRPIGVTIPLHEKKINVDKMIEVLLRETSPPEWYEPRIFHLDISHEVKVFLSANYFMDKL